MIDLHEYWWMIPYVALFAFLVLYLAVRLVLDWLDHRKARRMQPYAQTWGGAVYYGQHRQNFRRP